ncbi:serine/threonine protein phosphatase [Rubripirellula amarantea]|uniref:Serine/threonine-protein phosphatase 1 n=1 Tax=Rubripirellula amarantea TaxID=2527999 RepID=A0A5C5WB04_9BACT|nr:metallophosphoesterase family protein [Rubripirellula amarantea]MDA8743480.1 serine/threonine protein phosphatase [Rubripirellula amarantea]TWT48096.1 Serine/threonine-protein phosphatase 1 [Rubripirellula amarantea]
MRRFVIGDIHGCDKALRTIIDTIAPNPSDEIIFLGDYIDRGPNSKGVIEQLLKLTSECQVITLRGNHEIMLQGVALHGLDEQLWLANGGRATLTSYGGKIAKIPDSHMDFFHGLRAYHETGESIFVHAGYDHSLEMHRQPEMNTYWMHLAFPFPPPHVSGKRVYVGHSPQGSGDILDLGHLVCLDTYCFGGGYLTAFNLDTLDCIQADRHGHLRRAPFAIVGDGIKRLASRLGATYRKFSKDKTEPDDDPTPDAKES